VLRTARVVLLQANPAAANPFDVVGLTARHAALGGAGAAAADDAAAVYYNPAGLVARRGAELSIGITGAYARLRHTGGIADPGGAQLALRLPLPLRGALADRLVIGLALHLLPGEVARVIAPAPDEPYYATYGDRMARIVVLPGAALRLGPIALGASVDVLAGLAGAIDSTEGATRALETRTDAQIDGIARAIAGVTWQVTPDLRLGAVYRQRFDLPVAVATTTRVADEPIDLDLRVRGQFAPHQLVVGAAFARPAFTAMIDLRYARWRDYAGPYAVVESRLPLVGEVPALAPPIPFDDTLGARAGLEWRLGPWTARGGYGFETSPVPAAQAGVTNLLDGPRHTIAAGAGRELGRWRVDAYVQLQHVAHRTLEKLVVGLDDPDDPFGSLKDEDLDTLGLQITNPGYPSIEGGGNVIAGGVTVEVAL
jgi:hypothetical protein